MYLPSSNIPIMQQFWQLSLICGWRWCLQGVERKAVGAGLLMSTGAAVSFHSICVFFFMMRRYDEQKYGNSLVLDCGKKEFFFLWKECSLKSGAGSLTVKVLICGHLVNHVDCIVWLSFFLVHYPVAMPLFSVHSFSILVIEEKEKAFSL